MLPRLFLPSLYFFLFLVLKVNINKRDGKFITQITWERIGKKKGRMLRVWSPKLTCGSEVGSVTALVLPKLRNKNSIF